MMKPLIQLRDIVLQKFPLYIELARLDRPIGIFLLLWPTLTALWISQEGQPEPKFLLIFILGVILMRSAGCVINDYADRHWDRHIRRTQNRPLTSKRLTSLEALIFFSVLCLLAFGLVLLTNAKTIMLSFIALGLAALYPFTKRFTQFPQFFLGAAFSMGIPMAFAATQNIIPQEAWLLYLFALVWTVAYDAEYAMVDREDDIKVGIRSIAIFFGENDRLAIAMLQATALLPLFLLAKKVSLGAWFYFGIVGMVGLFVYQHWLIKDRVPKSCFKAFLNNAWVGASLYCGVVLHFLTVS